ncbi:MAG: hypothetical protein GY925_13510 [Actinomycetia bacterium]|nr:hypothetical protein [Actinomycetes bacterium]
MTDPLLAAGPELLAFTDAAILHDPDEMPEARLELAASAGPDAVVRAAAVAGNFQMMNRLLDGIGVKISRHAMTLANELGLTVPAHLHSK